MEVVLASHKMPATSRTEAMTVRQAYVNKSLAPGIRDQAVVTAAQKQNKSQSNTTQTLSTALGELYLAAQTAAVP